MTAATRLRALGFSLLTASLAWSCGDAIAQGKSGKKPATAKTDDGYRITGPYTHENLAVFLIHGKDRLQSGKLLTLQEAIEQKKIVVHETGDVNELAVENVSPDVDVYIQSADIVKGGRQDRMISQDLIVPPRSGRMPIGSFCVERGRWSPREKESPIEFSASSDQAVGKSLKIAARRKADQGEVWKEVAVAQEKLIENVGYAPSSVSPSSLQLTLEDGKVTERAARYVHALSARRAGEKDLVGAAFAVNGVLNSAEIYASRALFDKLWPKLVRAAAVEAIAEAKAGRTAKAPTPADVKAWLADADRARAEAKELSPRVKLVTREAGRNVLFETLDRKREDAWVHRSYVAK